MISGAHVVIYSTDAEADRTFFRDVLGFPSVDAGHGWLIFALPPSEIACHPAADNGRHEIYLMSDDVGAAIQSLEKHNVQCDSVADVGWGLLTHLSLPGGGRLGLYQPKHPMAAGKIGGKPGV
jgi:catechol 2,3-dioxygenase-like lactoylglutathione lyase family enzyme